jgi:DNA polymerase (family 10)
MANRTHTPPGAAQNAHYNRPRADGQPVRKAVRAAETPMTNRDVARIFEQVADLMEIRGEDSFRVNAYRKAARTLEELAEDVRNLAGRGELEKLPGIGKGSRERIEELLETGKLKVFEDVCAEVPPSLLEMRAIPGLGPKKIAQLWKSKNILTLADLKAALESGALTGLRGFGEKGLEQIRRGLEFVEKAAGRHRLSTAAEVGEMVRQAVRAMPGVERVELAGSLRRGRETVGDLDVLCIASDGAEVVRRFASLPEVKQVLGAGDTKGSVQFEYRPGRTIQIDLRVVPAESFGAAWQYFTGSKEHNVRLRERAVKRGWSLNEYGLTKGDRVIASRTEEEIYEALGAPCVPPEMREDRGELDLKAAPKDLIALKDIRGDLHMHTSASDGQNTIEELVAAAILRGYKYICITDHSQSSTIANGLKPDRLVKHVAAIRKVARQTREVTVWAGAEVDILSDGRLDYPDDVLAELDWVVASVHSGMGNDVKHNTERTLAAIENPYVNLIAHPTGRLINRRDAMPLDIEAVAKEAAKTGTALEINASTYRLDLKDQHARLACELGATICIDTDAHAIDQLDQMQYGVITARRAWLRKGDVLNTRPAREITAFAQAKRKRA